MKSAGHRFSLFGRGGRRSKGPHSGHDRRALRFESLEDRRVLSDSASLVSQTVANNAVEVAGAQFEQTWTMQNSGTTTWSSSYNLVLIGTDVLGVTPLSADNDGSGNHKHPFALTNGGGSVAPGSSATFSMDAIAPEAAGTYTDTFQMENASGTAFGSKVYIQIVVAQAGPAGTYDRAKAVSYANNYAYYVVTDGYYWTSSSGYTPYTPGSAVPSTTGDDCAHFVSSCIGSEATTPTGGGLTIPSRALPTYGEPGAERLIDTVLEGGGLAEPETSLSSLEPGDVVGWDWNDGPGVVDHVTLYLGNDELASHANSHLDVPMSFYEGTGDTFYLIHITDTAPATPTGLAASATGSQSISVTWNTSGGSTGGYTLDRGTSSSGPWTQVYSGAAAQYADSGLQPNTTYYYEVSASNNGVSSAFSSPRSATTPTAGNPPATPTGLGASVSGVLTILASWNTANGAISYTLDRATSSAGPWTQVYSGAATQYTDSGLQPQTTYYYEVLASNAGGSSSFSSSASATTASPPATPTGLSASTTGVQTISVAWNTASGATGYTLDRATSSAGPWTQVYSSSATQFADSGLQFGTTYYYKVSASNTGGSSAFSSLPAAASTYTGVPLGLAASASGQQSIAVQWDSVSGATTYTLDRATSSGGPWTAIYTGSATQYSSNGLQIGATYYYIVRSGTSTANSVFSSAVSGTTLPSVPTSLAASATGVESISISWDAATGATGYSLDYATSSNGPWTQVYSGTAAQYSASGLPCGTTCYYEVSATNSGGNSAMSAAASATTFTGVPTGLGAAAGSVVATWSGAGSGVNWSDAANWGGTAAGGLQSAAVSWNSVSGATGYVLDRSTSPSGPWIQVYSGAAAQYTDAGLQPNAKYYYEVSSAMSSGNSAFSSMVSTATNYTNLSFGGSAGLSNVNDIGPVPLGGMTFNAGAGAFTLGGAAVNLAGGLVNNSTSKQTVALGITLVGGSQSITAAAGDVAISGNIGESGGHYGINVTGPGTVTLTGTNSYSGGTLVSSGKLVMASPNSLSSGSALTVGTNLQVLDAVLAEYGRQT